MERCSRVMHYRGPADGGFRRPSWTSDNDLVPNEPDNAAAALAAMCDLLRVLFEDAVQRWAEPPTKQLVMPASHNVFRSH
jgi:hypothetical protein